MRARQESLLEALLLALAAVFLVAGFYVPVYHAPPFEPVERGDDVIRIVSWNVGNSLDGGGGGPLESQDLEHISERLKRLDPDLIILQEVRDTRQLRSLRRSLDGKWDDVHSPKARRNCVGIIARGRLAPFSMRDRDGRSAGAVTTLRSGEEVAIAALHANAFSSKERNTVIGGALERLLERPEGLQILAGDLNIDLDLDKRRDLFSDNEYMDVETYNFIAKELLDTGVGSGPTAEPDRRLDYIFVTSDAFEVLRAGPWKGQRVGRMDHDPVVADLRLR